MFKRIEAMRTGRDCLNLVGVQRGNVLLGHHLEQHFIAHASGEVFTGALFSSTPGMAN